MECPEIDERAYGISHQNRRFFSISPKHIRICALFPKVRIVIPAPRAECSLIRISGIHPELPRMRFFWKTAGSHTGPQGYSDSGSTSQIYPKPLSQIRPLPRRNAFLLRHGVRYADLSFLRGANVVRRRGGKNSPGVPQTLLRRGLKYPLAERVRSVADGHCPETSRFQSELRAHRL